MALMMSTSEPLTDPDTGVTYSPRQQGSGLMQLQEAVTSPAYLLVGEKEGNDGKVKLTFGDDAERTGVYTGSFSVQNLSDSPLHYALSGKVTTMAVEEIEGEDYMSDSAYALDANVTFSADGKSVYVYDLNGDDKVDEQDALVLLQAANGTHDALDAETVQKYDLDADGTITTADAQLYLAAVKGDKSVVDVYAVTYEVPANGSMNVSFTVRLTDGDKAWLNGHYPNGSYIEGFLYADSCDGDGRQLSVPMLGFYGSWAEPSMYDKSVYLEDMCTEGATGYVAQRTNFLVQRMAGSTSGYYFGGNLYAEDDEAIADRASFANESGNTIYAAVPTMIRNASDLKVTIRNAETGEVLEMSVRDETAAPAEGSQTDAPVSGTTTTPASGSSHAASASVQAAPNTNASAGKVDEARAKEIALNHAGVKAADATVTKSKLDYEDGRQVYEIEFYVSGSSGYTEYDYEIEAATGKIVSYDHDAESYAPPAQSTNSGMKVTEATAKKTALSRVSGATEKDIYEWKLDYDDGRTEYEGKIIYGGMEYEFTINAATGAVTEWDAESVYD